MTWGRTTEICFKVEMEKLQYLALCLQGLFRRNMSRKAIEVISGIEPLHLNIERNLLNSAYRNREHLIKLNEINPTFKPKVIKHKMETSSKRTVDFLISKLKEIGIDIYDKSHDHMPTLRVHERNFEVDANSLTVNTRPEKQPSYTIYTDGSKYKNRVGSGVTIDNFADGGQYNEDIAFHLSNHSTVFQAEVKAISLAADLLKNIQVKRKEIHFYVDSQSAIYAISADLIKSKEVYETIQILNNIGDQNKIIFHWVKAHAGFAGNEAADQLAKEGATQVHGPHATSKIPHSYVKLIVNKYIITKWNEEWQNATTGNRTKQFFPKIDLAKSKRLYNTTKDIFSMAVRFITGQNGLNYYNNKINPTEFESSLCKLCEEEDETAEHILTECVVMNLTRFKTFGHWKDIELDKIKPEQLHKFLKSDSLKHIENISENPLLFLKDYDNVTHEHPIHNKRAFHLFYMPDDIDDDDAEDGPSDPNSPKRIRRGIG